MRITIGAVTSTAAVARFSSLLLCGLSTGVLFGTRTGLGPSTSHFSPTTYVEVQQATVRNLRPVMGVLLPGAVATNVVVLAVTRQDHRSRAFALRSAGLGGQLVALLLTALVELPINAQVLTWSSAAPPSGWQRTRNRWATAHTARTISAVGALVCLAAAATNDR